MKTATMLFGLMAASTALAAPGTKARRARHEQRRAAGTRQSHPMIPAAKPAGNDRQAAASSVQYSQNWSGAVLVGTGYTGVNGTFTVPNPQAPSGGDSSTAYAASAWVGIDGDTCQSAILQTGVDFTVQDGQVSYDAWYEWYPDYAYDFSGISFSAGDNVLVSVTADSTTSGVAYIENLSTGQSVTHSFSNEGSEGDLCQTNAEWIVEDFEQGSSLVPLVNFGSITFSDAIAYTNDGQVGPSGAQLIDMSTSGSSSGVEAQTSLNGNNVVVNYVG